MFRHVVILSTFDIRISSLKSYRFFADLFRANSNRVFHREDENFTVADFSGFGCADYRGDRFVHHVIGQDDFHLHFR